MNFSIHISGLVDQLVSPSLGGTTQLRLKALDLDQEISSSDPLVNDVERFYVGVTEADAKMAQTYSTYLRRFFFYVGRKSNIPSPQFAELR
jgi:hypothetical protein